MNNNQENQSLNQIIARAIDSAFKSYNPNESHNADKETIKVTDNKCEYETKADNDNIINKTETDFIIIPIDEFKDVLKKLDVFQNLLIWFYEDYYQNENVNIKRIAYQYFEQTSKTKDFMIIINMIIQELAKYGNTEVGKR